MEDGKPFFVVGSSSKWRREILDRHLGRRFRILHCSPDIDEKAVRHEDPEVLVTMIALEKLKSVQRKLATPTFALRSSLDPSNSAYFIYTSDQVALFNGAIREKPESVDQNMRFLRDYRNACVETIASTVLYSGFKKCVKHLTNTTRTCFADIPEDVIERVVARGESMQCCGGFVIEDEDLSKCVRSIDVGSVEQVQGMCMASVLGLLEQFTADSVSDPRVAGIHQ
jgi:septum formation protein